MFLFGVSSRNGCFFSRNRNRQLPLQALLIAGKNITMLKVRELLLRFTVKTLLMSQASIPVKDCFGRADRTSWAVLSPECNHRVPRNTSLLAPVITKKMRILCSRYLPSGIDRSVILAKYLCEIHPLIVFQP